MFFDRFFHRKPAHTAVRFMAATSEENRAARQRRADKRMELEIMAIHMTPEQRAAAKARATQRLQGRAI